jgi:hypothetical protein
MAGEYLQTDETPIRYLSRATVKASSATSGQCDLLEAMCSITGKPAGQRTAGRWDSRGRLLSQWTIELGESAPPQGSAGAKREASSLRVSPHYRADAAGRVRGQWQASSADSQRRRNQERRWRRRKRERRRKRCADHPYSERKLRNRTVILLDDHAANVPLMDDLLERVQQCAPLSLTDSQYVCVLTTMPPYEERDLTSSGGGALELLQRVLELLCERAGVRLLDHVVVIRRNPRKHQKTA